MSRAEWDLLCHALWLAYQECGLDPRRASQIVDLCERTGLDTTWQP